MSRRLPPAPRWQTPLPPGVVGTWGPDVADWAAAELRIELDRWQRRALNRALAVVELKAPSVSLPRSPTLRLEGVRLAHSTYLASTARQNGKTVIVRSLVGWALTARSTPPWARILGLAHDRQQARIPYEAVLADLAGIQRRSPRAGLVLTRYLGIRSDLFGRHREYHTGSRESRNAIRGTSNDLGLFDELRTQLTYETWAALEPTITARPDPLIVGTSTAGDDRSRLLRDWWERMVRIVRGDEPMGRFGATWYAANDDDDPADPRAWRRASPSVAEGRLSDELIAESYRSTRNSPATFKQERLNLWSSGVGDEILPPGVWARQIRPRPATGDRVVLAIEAASSWHRATIIVAIATDDGAWIGVAGELDAATSGSGSPTISPAELVDETSRLIAAWHVGEIAYSRAAAAALHLEALADSLGIRAIALGPRELRSASELWRSELIGGRLGHADDPLLAAQARDVRPSGSLEGDWYLSARESQPADVDGIRASAWGAWAAISPDARPPAPAIH